MLHQIVITKNHLTEQYLTHMHAYTDTQTHICIHTKSHTLSSKFTCTCTYTHARAHTHMHACIHTRIHMYTYAQIIL